MKKLTAKKLSAILLIADLVLAGVFVALNLTKNETAEDRHISGSNIKRICELATLDCYYHNVTEWSKEGNWIGYGAKKLWLEYDGIVRVGVSAGQIVISEPDEENVVTVSIPAATILENDLDETSIREISSELPMWGFVPLYESVSSEERRDAIAEAQKDMAANASVNEALLSEARERAKTIIEKYITSIGEASGKHYKVRFAEVPTSSD